MNKLALSMLVLALLSVGASGQTKINLGTADNFAVLAGSAITNTSASTYIIGGVGSYPTCGVTGIVQSQVKGHLYLSCSPVLAQAQNDLGVAYNQAAGEPCNEDLTGTDLGGLTLTPGVYCFSSSAGLTGTLTLDAQGNRDAQWVFQIGSTLTTASNSTVALVIGKKPKVHPLWGTLKRGCNVYWQVGSSATIGTGSNFLGDIMALTSITLDGGVLKGKALASNGAVTMSAQETVDGGRCL